MGRFHRHADGTEHAHEHADDTVPEHGHTTPGRNTGPASQAGQPGRTVHSGHLEPGRTIGDMSGYQTGSQRIEVLENIFDENDRTAAANRADFDRAGVRVVNLMSSPGAGKTTLLRRTLAALDGSRVGIIEGDIETSIDADRLAGFGASVALINTGNGFGGECHLDAPMVRSALPKLPLDELDLVIIENVGNLVCPAEFTVGEHYRAMVYAVTEGEEKPLKYPVMFRSVDLVLVNKVDLLPFLDMDLSAFYANLRDVNPAVTTIEVSARTGDGLDAWLAWLTGAGHGTE